MITVACPRCRVAGEVPDGANRFVCQRCGRHFTASERATWLERSWFLKNEWVVGLVIAGLVALAIGSVYALRHHREVQEEEALRQMLNAQQHNIRPGMSREEVRSILGTPTFGESYSLSPDLHRGDAVVWGKRKGSGPCLHVVFDRDSDGVWRVVAIKRERP